MPGPVSYTHLDVYKRQVVDVATQVHGVEQALAAFAHQGVIAVDFDAIGLQLDQFSENVGGPVE